MANTRIYGVQNNSNGDVVLVEAFDASRALAFVAKNHFDVKTVSALTLAEMMKQGYTVFKAHKSEEI